MLKKEAKIRNKKLKLNFEQASWYNKKDIGQFKREITRNPPTRAPTKLHAELSVIHCLPSRLLDQH